MADVVIGEVIVTSTVLTGVRTLADVDVIDTGTVVVTAIAVIAWRSVVLGDVIRFMK
jgi:hypothetical protein